MRKGRYLEISLDPLEDYRGYFINVHLDGRLVNGEKFYSRMIDEASARLDVNFDDINVPIDYIDDSNTDPQLEFDFKVILWIFIKSWELLNNEPSETFREPFKALVWHVSGKYF